MTPPPTPRKPGAPLGNTNALKHGFYSRKFLRADIKDLAEYEFRGLAEEILLLRVYQRHVAELGREPKDLKEAIQVLCALSLSSASLGHLLKAQKIYDSTGMGEFLKQAIQQVAEEWACNQPAKPAAVSPGLPSASTS